MKNAGWHIPARSGIQAISLGVTGNFVVTLGEIFQALQDLILGGTRFKPKKGVWIIRTVIVGLWRKVIGLRLAKLTDFRGIFVVVVNVVRKRLEYMLLCLS